MKTKNILFAIIVTFFIQACLSSSLKNNVGTENNFIKIKKNNLPKTAGVYYINGSNLEEILENYGNKVDFINLPVFQDTNPQFIVYDNKVDQNSYFLYNSYGEKWPIEYQKIDDPDQNINMELVQIRMNESLNDGFYCFSNDIFVHPENYNINDPTWCFGYGSEEMLGMGYSNEDMKPPKNEIGFFIVRKEGVEALPSMIVDENLDINKLPLIDNYLPKMVYQSNTENPNNVKLYRYRAQIGISFAIFGNYPDGMIASVEKNSGADLAGILPEDVIISVNNQDARGRSDQEISSLIQSSCLPNKKIDLVILRGTQQSLAQPVCMLGTFDEIKGIDYILQPDGYAIFQSKYPLFSDNIYCVKVLGEKEFSCFRVE